MIHLSARTVIPDEELKESFFQSSGPGGQNVNKVATAVRLAFDIARSSALSEIQKLRLKANLASRLTSDGVIAVTASSQRTQLDNRREAAERLTALLQGALTVPRKRRPTKPTKGSVERRLNAKKKHAEVKKTRRTSWD